MYTCNDRHTLTAMVAHRVFMESNFTHTTHQTKVVWESETDFSQKIFQWSQPAVNTHTGDDTQQYKKATPTSLARLARCICVGQCSSYILKLKKWPHNFTEGPAETQQFDHTFPLGHWAHSRHHQTFSASYWSAAVELPIMTQHTQQVTAVWKDNSYTLCCTCIYLLLQFSNFLLSLFILPDCLHRKCTHNKNICEIMWDHESIF